jgi:hypothetical protein
VAHEAIDEANRLLREKGYEERDLAVHPTPMGPDRALLKGNRIVSPFSDHAGTILRVVSELVPPAGELGHGSLRPAELRAALAREPGSPG